MLVKGRLSNFQTVLFAGIFLVSLALPACAQKTIEKQTDAILSELDNGKVVGNVYENTLLGFKISFPKSMTPDTKADMEPVVQEVIDKLKQGKSQDKKVIDEFIKMDRIIFSLDMLPTDESLGASFTLTIKKDQTNEELRPMVDRTVAFFTGSGKQKLVEAVAETNLGSVKVFTFRMSEEAEGVSVISRVITGRRNGYYFTLSGSYADKVGQEVVDSVVKGIEVK